MRALVIFFLIGNTLFTLAQNIDWVQASWGGQSTGQSSMVADSAGNMYVTGTFWGKESKFQGVQLDSNGTGNVFVAKYNSNGKLIWAVNSTYSERSSNYPRVSTIKIDSKGNSYIIGYFGDDISFGDIKLETSQFANIYLTKISADGNFLWAKQFGDKPTSEFGYGLEIDNEDNIYITGSYSFYAPLVLGDTSLSKEKNDGIGAVFVAKFNKDGDLFWAKSGISGRLRVANDGSVYLVGQYQHYVVWGVDTIRSMGGADYFIAKLDKYGKERWIRSIRSEEFDFVNGFELDAEGNLYVLGKFGESTYFGDVLKTDIELSQYYVTKFNENGEFVWLTKMESDTNQFNYGILHSTCNNELLFVAEESEIITQYNHWKYKNHGLVLLGIDLESGLLNEKISYTQIPVPEAIGDDKYGNFYLYNQYYRNETIESNTITSEHGNYGRYLARLGHYNGNFSKEKGILIYPNPVSTQLKIEVSETSSFPINCFIFNNLGQHMGDFKLSSYYAEIDVSYLSLGFYYLEVEQEGFGITKFIKY